MAKMRTWSLLILSGLAVMLGGLAWDGVIHATEHSHLVVEALFDPGNPFENPAHVAIGIGLAWTTVAALGAFTVSWLENKDWRAHWRTLSVPLALWSIMGAVGVAALIVLAQTP